MCLRARRWCPRGMRLSPYTRPGRRSPASHDRGRHLTPQLRSRAWHRWDASTPGRSNSSARRSALTRWKRSSHALQRGAARRQPPSMAPGCQTAGLASRLVGNERPGRRRARCCAVQRAQPAMMVRRFAFASARTRVKRYMAAVHNQQAAGAGRPNSRGL
jgi:hypothetical protein